MLIKCHMCLYSSSQLKSCCQLQPLYYWTELILREMEIRTARRCQKGNDEQLSSFFMIPSCSLQSFRLTSCTISPSCNMIMYYYLIACGQLASGDSRAEGKHRRAMISSDATEYNGYPIIQLCGPDEEYKV